MSFFRGSRWRGLGWLIAGRIAAALPMLLLAATLIFLIVALLPGDLAAEMLGRDATPETLANLRRQLGLDQPLPLQYLSWLSSVAQGDLGVSLASGRPVSDLVGARLQNTLLLAGLAALMAVPLALTLGIVSALWRDTVLDRLVSVTMLAGISIPDFLVAYLFILLLAVLYPVFPSIANIDPSMSLWEWAWRSLLPALTLTMIVTAPMMRMTRVAIIDALSSPYVEMATLKGTRPLTIILRHVFPNVVAPVATVIMLNLGYLVVGVVIIEVVFAYPGLGQLLVDSVGKRDVPVVQACSLAFATTYIILNLVADIISLASDPRRMSRS